MSSLDPFEKLYRETSPCEHGRTTGHLVVETWLDAWCRGVVREEVTIDYEAAARVWLGDKLFNDLKDIDGAWDAALVDAVEHLVKPMFDAALKSAGFTKKFASGESVTE